MQNQQHKSPLTLIWNAVCFIIIAVSLYFYISHYILFAYRFMHCNDFKHIYIGAEVLVKGGNPYDINQLFFAAHLHGIERLNPYVYPPFTGLVLGFLTFFDFLTAARVWFVLNHLFLWLSIALIFISMRLPLKPGYIALTTLLAGTLYPFFRTLTAGQLNCALLLLIVLTWWAYSRKKFLWAGFIVAFATLFKLSPGIFFLFFLWKRNWRAVGYGFLFFIILLGFSISVANPEVHVQFLPLLSAMSYGHSTWASLGMDFFRDPFNQSFNSLFHHLFTQTPYTVPIIEFGETFANILTYLVSIGLILLVLGNTMPLKGSQRRPEELEFSLFVFLSLLIPSLMWDHYLTMLIFPIFVIARHIKPRDYLQIVLFVLALYVVCRPILFSAPAFQQGIGILLMSCKLWATLILFTLNIHYLCEYRRREHDDSRATRYDEEWS